jgi:hypothetical protein
MPTSAVQATVVNNTAPSLRRSLSFVLTDDLIWSHQAVRNFIGGIELGKYGPLKGGCETNFDTLRVSIQILLFESIVVNFSV